MSQRYLLAGARGGQGTTTVATVLAVLSAGHRPTVLTTTQVDDVCALTGIPRPGPSSTTSICPNLTLTSAAQPTGDEHCEPAWSSGGNDGPDRAPRFADGRRPNEPGCSKPAVSVVDLGRLDQVNDAEPQDQEADVVRWLVVRGPCYLSLRAAVEHRWEPDGIVLLAEPGRALSGADVSDVLGAPVVAQVPIEPTVARVIDAGLLLARLRRLSAFRSLAPLVRACDGYEAPLRSQTAL
jgi:hypothetical protein